MALAWGTEIPGASSHETGGYEEGRERKASLDSDKPAVNSSLRREEGQRGGTHREQRV